MRELLRAYAKAEMQRQGYTKVNRLMRRCWRMFVGTYTPPGQKARRKRAR